MGLIGLIFRKLFGVLALLLGSSIAIWILYNTLIEKQTEFDWQSYQGLGIAIPMIAVGIYWLMKKRD